MNKSRIKVKNKKEPNYLGVSNMAERVQVLQIHQFAQSLTRELGQENALLENLPNSSQTNNITNAIVSLGLNSDFESIEALLPTLSSDEISARAFKLFLSKFKQMDNRNPFLSSWNEWSARLAAQQINFPEKDLHQILDGKNTFSQELRNRQTQISSEMESLIKREITQKTPETLKRIILLETWAKSQTEELRHILEASQNDLSKEEKELIITDTLSALLKVTEFSKNQKFPFKKLRDTLLQGRLGKNVSVVNLQCVSFLNSEKDGITVSPTAEDFWVTNSQGNKVLVSQKDAIDKVEEFSAILAKFNIPVNITFLVFDNDKIILPGQEENVKLCIESFKNVLSKHPISKFLVEVIPASQIVNPSNFENEWHKLSIKREKFIEKIVDEEFERLQPKTLPSKQKSREFARQVAKKGFLLQFSVGATIPNHFENTIVLQRTNAPQQSSEVFRMGAAMVEQNDALIIAHWKDRKSRQ